MIRVKAVVVAAVGVTTGLVFFPRWIGIPIAVLTGAVGLGTAVLGGTVVIDRAAGLLVLRMGLITRRIRFTDITAVLVDQAKVSVARVKGGEVSLYAWRKGRLDALLGVPLAASDIGHAISRAATAAQVDSSAHGVGAPPSSTRGPAVAGRTPARTRSRLTTALLGAAGVLAIVGALLVRVSWPSPVLTVLGVILALALGVSGLLYLLVALWIALTGRAPRVLAS